MYWTTTNRLAILSQMDHCYKQVAIENWTPWTCLIIVHIARDRFTEVIFFNLSPLPWLSSSECNVLETSFSLIFIELTKYKKGVVLDNEKL